MRLARPAVAALATALCLGALPATADAAPGGAARQVTGSVAASAGRTPAGPTVHSSDGRRGPLLSSVTGRYAGSTAQGPVDPVPTGWQVVPGLRYDAWTVAQPQGPVRLHLLTADLAQPGLVLDQVSGPAVPQRAALSTWLRADRAVAGVNGDFFDITDTGAPLGVGVDRERRTLHAPARGWNTTFVLDTAGRARVVQDRLVARVSRRGRAPIGIARFNSPVVPVDRVGLYDAAWGTAPGPAVVDRATRVREVRVRGGVVRSNRRTLSRGTRITGSLLVGRAAGARALRALRVGQRVTVSHALSVPARVAVSGSAVLLSEGRTVTADHGELHPRTAVGIDQDTRTLHLLVADGRSPTSAGLTLVQLAEQLRSLGDDDALNLDGGGSSTLVAADPAGTAAVRNQPSDGRERAVPNGLGFRWTPPVS